MSNQEETLFEFPCEFPLKVMGRNETGFENHVMAIIYRHIDEIKILDSKCRPSKKGNFVSVSITILAQSKQQLDDLYIELNASDAVLMTL
ncbi:Proposed lipoate regulatory protein YbeD [hydrothermal vent metagenome]|uniref:Proposed lipoate regulatory protein YbeD n=1 Tax=hydrothermal vent metagenome TaxID=652676 RepID=A0A3B1AM99_9ZZZZ